MKFKSSNFWLGVLWLLVFIENITLDRVYHRYSWFDIVEIVLAGIIAFFEFALAFDTSKFKKK